MYNFKGIDNPGVNERKRPAGKVERKAGRVLIAVDPSLTASGWAAFDISSSKPLAAGVLSPPGPEQALHRRLQNLHEKVQALFSRLSFGKGDILICEGPAPLIKNPQSALKVEQVRGIFECAAREIGAIVPGRINPRTVQSELLSLSGKQLPRIEVKRTARATALQLYGNYLKDEKTSQDICDALLVGTLALSRIHLAKKQKVDLYELFAEKNRRRPSARNRASGRLESWSLTDLRVVVGRGSR